MRCFIAVIMMIFMCGMVPRQDTQPYLDTMDGRPVKYIEEDGDVCDAGISPDCSARLRAGGPPALVPPLDEPMPLAIVDKSGRQAIQSRKPPVRRIIRDIPPLYLPYVKAFDEPFAFRRYIADTVALILRDHKDTIAYVVAIETMSDEDRLLVVRQRLNGGENPNLRLIHGVTALHIAVARGDLPIIRLLCQPSFLRNREALLRDKRLISVPDNRALLLADQHGLDPRMWAYMLFVHPNYDTLLVDLDAELIYYNRYK